MARKCWWFTIPGHPEKKGRSPSYLSTVGWLCLKIFLTKRLKESTLCQRVPYSKIKSKVNLDSHKTGVHYMKPNDPNKALFFFGKSFRMTIDLSIKLNDPCKGWKLTNFMEENLSQSGRLQTIFSTGWKRKIPGDLSIQNTALWCSKVQIPTICYVPTTSNFLASVNCSACASVNWTNRH